MDNDPSSDAEGRARADDARHDAWRDGEAYEAYVGRWSRPTARAFVDWLELPAGSSWIDLGCGTGALARAILERADPERVLGVEPSEGFRALARERIDDPRVSFAAGSGEAIPGADGSVDAVVSGFVLNFLPDPATGLAEMRRVTRPGGTVAAYVWDYAGKAELFRIFWDAAAALDPDAAALDEGRRFPLCDPERLERLFADAGFERVEVRALDVPTPFRDVDDFWRPFLGGMGPAPGYVASLSEARREALRERVVAALPVAADGSVRLLGRSWAVRGEVAR